MELFSASDLVKKTCKQLKYLRGKEKVVTQEQLSGEEYQHKLAQTLVGANEEMKTTFVCQGADITIFACHDIVTDKFIAEIKDTSKFEVKEYYKQKSLLQAAFYKSLLMESNGILTTPEFRIQQGFEPKTMTVDKNIEYILMFGNEKYNIEVGDSFSIVFYFVKKALISLESYNTIEEYERLHKHKEFEELQGCFKYTRTN